MKTNKPYPEMPSSKWDKKMNNGVKVKNVKGLLVENILIPDSEPLNSNIRGYNQCRTEQGERSIGLDRERSLECLKKIPSHGIPITKDIETGKIYHYMCKEEIV